jgi:hypothetical protein
MDYEIAGQISLDVLDLGDWFWATWRGNLCLCPCAQHLRRDFVTGNPFVGLGVVVIETVVVCVSSYASDNFCVEVVDVAFFMIMGATSLVIASGIILLFRVTGFDFFECCVTAAAASPSTSHVE